MGAFCCSVKEFTRYSDLVGCRLERFGHALFKLLPRGRRKREFLLLGIFQIVMILDHLRKRMAEGFYPVRGHIRGQRKRLPDFVRPEEKREDPALISRIREL